MSKYSQDSIDQLLSSVPFYKTVKQSDQYQYDLLLRNSKVIECSPGEVILEKGRKGDWFYFLLKGQLEVHSQTPRGQKSIVNYVTPGEVFGDLAILFDYERSATVVADRSCNKIVIFATHFGVFGQLEEFHPISLKTKLIYYRNMVHNLRWKLEVYRVAHAEQPLASEHRSIRLYSGPRDTLQELRSLDKQARELATLLVRWNNKIEGMSLNPRTKTDPANLKAIS